MLLENSPKAFTPINTHAPPPAVCLAACDPRPVTSRYREPPYPTDAGGGGHRPTPGRHQVCTCTFAGNIRLPQPAPGRHRTGSPGGPRPVTAGFLRKSGVDPAPTRARRRSCCFLDTCLNCNILPDARGGTFAEFCKSPLWYPTPTHARRHPAFAEFCKACTRPLLRENGRREPHISP